MNFRISTLSIAAAAALMSMSSVAHATAITVDGGYYRFGLDTVGDPVTARDASGSLLATTGSPFTFTALGDVVLTIVDLQLSVDRFQVTINSVDQGLTSQQTAGGDVGLDVMAALADARFSRGIYNLGAGAYTVEIVLAEGDFLPGSGAIGVRSVVSEPAVLGLMGLGLAGLLAARRRRAPAA